MTITRTHRHRRLAVALATASIATTALLPGTAASASGSGSGAASGSGSGGRTAGCRAPRRDTTNVVVPIDGHDRTALVHVPASLDLRHRAPLVLSFHGSGTTAEFQAGYDGVDAEGDAAGYISVHPQGLPVDLLGNGSIVLGWDLYNPDTRDPAFVRALLTQLDSVLCIDSRRVYATGISNGGGMAQLLACTLTDRIAAIAPVAALPALPCPGAAPTPTIAFHGRQDLFVPYDGIRAVGLPGVEDVVGAIAIRNGCSPEPPARRAVTAHVERIRWDDCRAQTVLYRIEQHGHAWPGHSFGLTETQWKAFFTANGPPLGGLTIAQAAFSLSLTTNEIDATALAWQFFRSRGHESGA